jgi:hypothetical protein
MLAFFSTPYSLLSILKLPLLSNRLYSLLCTLYSLTAPTPYPLPSTLYSLTAPTPYPLPSTLYFSDKSREYLLVPQLLIADNLQLDRREFLRRESIVLHLADKPKFAARSI